MGSSLGLLVSHESLSIGRRHAYIGSLFFYGLIILINFFLDLILGVVEILWEHLPTIRLSQITLAGSNGVLL